MREAADQLDMARVGGGSDLNAQLITLTAEVAELRRQLQDQAQVIAQLQAERDVHCCPWWAQPWHRDHASRAT
jgi:hypothetical protein